MALHLLKLCVGCDSVVDLEEWIAMRLDQRRAAGEPVEHFHTTRMVPTRAAELVDGGSLYWVIKGNVQCRQRLVEVRPFVDSQGILGCDLGAGQESIREMPQKLRRELAELGLL